MDDQRNPQAGTEQAGDAPEPRPTPMFDQDDERANLEEATRFARKRAAIWGLAAGGVMSLIVIVCAVLIYLLGTS